MFPLISVRPLKLKTVSHIPDLVNNRIVHPNMLSDDSFTYDHETLD